jgi:hypothetical protein
MKTNVDFFYTQVNSAPTKNYPENTPSKFTVELPNEVDLKGEWKVALAYAELPPTVTTFKQPIDYFIKKKGEIYIIVISFFNKTTNLWNGHVRLIFTGEETRVLSKKDLMITLQNAAKSLKILVDENGVFKIFNADHHKYVAYICISPARYTIFANFDNTQGLVKRSIEEIHSKITAKNPNDMNDVLKDFKYSPTLANEFSCYEVEALDEQKLISKFKFIFTVDDYFRNETAKKLEEEGHLSISAYKNSEEEQTLLNIYKRTYHIDRQLKNIPAWMFVYADFVKPSLIADCYSNVLKLLPYKQNYTPGAAVFYSFTPLDFFIVNSDSIKTLTFELRSHAGEIHDFRNNNEGNTLLTLFFQKID